MDSGLTIRFGKAGFISDLDKKLQWGDSNTSLCQVQGRTERERERNSAKTILERVLQERRGECGVGWNQIRRQASGRC